MKNRSFKIFLFISLLICFKISNAENVTISVLDTIYHTIGRDFYGIQYHSNTYNDTNAIDKLAKLNLNRIRIWANVSDFHPTPETWNWNNLDQKIEEITNLNYKLIVGMDECKEWFIGTSGNPWWNYSEGINEWKNAISHFINRYKDDLDMIIIFDEPNMMYPENDYYIPFQDAAQLYLQAAEQIKNIDTNILCGGPSSFGGWENGHFAKYVLNEPNGNEYLDFVSCNIFLSWNADEPNNSIMNKTIWYEEAPQKIRTMLGNECPPKLILDAYNASAVWKKDGVLWTDPRNINIFGGIYNAAALLHSAKGKYNITLHWETLGGTGVLNWYPEFRELDPYYSWKFLIDVAGLVENSKIIGCTTTELPNSNAPHHGGMNVDLYKIQPFAIRRIDGGISIVLINKYSDENMTATVNIPNGMQSYSLFRYDSTKIINCFLPLTEENVTSNIEVNCPAYSVTIIKFGLETVSKINDKEPEKFRISQNYPNPFNSYTKIIYAFPDPFYANITIYNLLGQKVVTLVNEKKTAGAYQATWNGRNTNGQIVHSGIYFYKTQLGDIIRWKKMVFVK